MQAGHYSSLLPDLFRHKNTKVRLFQPQTILLDFHGTISERRWEDKIIFPYVRRSIVQFVRDNFATDAVQRCLPGLRNESFEQRFRNKYEDAPIIEDSVEPASEDDDEQPQGGLVASQVGEFLLWQMQTKRETRETQTIERLVWQDGFRRKLISTPIFEDAMPCLQEWRERHQINLYVISSIDMDTLKLLLENTDRGNLHQHLSGYVCSKRSGDKLISDTYKQFYDRTMVLARSNGIKTAATSSSSSSTSNRSGHNSIARQPARVSEAKCSKSPPQPTISRSPRGANSVSSETGTAKPILFLTDSGQEAKAASMVADGQAFDCLLVNRPGNKRIRTYYLSKFQYIDKFDDIEFIQ